MTVVNYVPADVGACGYYRVMQQAHISSMLGKDIVLSAPGKFRAFGQDWIFTQRVASEPIFDKLMRFKESTKAKFVVDYDDLVWNYNGNGLPDYNICRTKIDTETNAMSMKMHLNEFADKITVSTPALKEAVMPFVDENKIHIMPNMLRFSEWAFPKRTTVPNDDIFMYAGSATHYDNEHKLPGDFSSGWIKYLSNKKIIVKSSVPYFMKPVATFKPSTLLTYAADFYNEASYAKFVIAPLANNFFNKCKSHLKFLECCAIGRVCLCTSFEGGPYEDAHEYQKVPYDATAQTIEYIVERAKAHYSEILEHQYAYLQKHWLDQHILEYCDLFEK